MFSAKKTLSLKDFHLNSVMLKRQLYIYMKVHNIILKKFVNINYYILRPHTCLIDIACIITLFHEK